MGKRMAGLGLLGLVAVATAAGLWWGLRPAPVEAQSAAPQIARVEARTPTLTVAPGGTVRLDLDLYNGSDAAMTATTQLIGWGLVRPGRDQERSAWTAVFFEARDRARNPRAPLASVAGNPAAVDYTAPDRPSVIGTTVTVRAVVAKADCTAGGRSTRSSIWHPPADWDGPCAADFTITIQNATSPPPPERFTLTLTPPTHGGLTAVPAGPAYAADTEVTLTATPDAGYRVAAWSGACASTAATSTTCTVMMDVDKTVGVTFTQGTAYTLTLAAAAHGTLTAHPAGASHAAGTVVTVTASPASGYALIAWDGACEGTAARSATCTVTMDADKTVSATFGQTCAVSGAVANPGTNPALVRDCEHLLAAKDLLAGTATLDWSAGTPLAQWTGVTLGGTPRRVTELRLADSGLSGQLSGRLGDLTGLQTLILNGNALTGPLPSKLGQLTRLTHVALTGNRFAGCVPPSLRVVPTNDVTALGLTDCPAPTDISYGDHTLTAGTYFFRWEVGEPPLIFDVPAGVSLALDGYVLEAPAERLAEPHGGLGLILKDAAGSSWIGLDVRRGGEWNRYLAPVPVPPPGAGTARGPDLGAAFDQVTASAWLVGGSAPVGGLQASALPPGTLQVADLTTPEASTVYGAGARNLILGEPIIVCENGNDYPKTTALAIEMFNTGLKGQQPDPFVAHDVFKWAANCPMEAPDNSPVKDRIEFVRITGSDFSDKTKKDQVRCSSVDATGCIFLYSRDSGDLYTLHGVLEMAINHLKRPPLYDDPNQWPRLRPLNVYENERKYVQRTIAHELGHALGLDDEYLQNPNCIDLITDDSLMACRPDGLLDRDGDGHEDVPLPALPLDYADLQPYDYTNYAHIYKPNVVAALPEVPAVAGQRPVVSHHWVERVPGQPGTLRFNFDARDVRVEAGIEIRRQFPSGWGPVLWPPADANGKRNPQATLGQVLGTVEITNQPESGVLTYGIFSTTQAYLVGQETRTGEGKIGFVGDLVTINDAPPTARPRPRPALVSTYELKIETNGRGRTLPRLGEHSYAANTPVTIRAIPAAGYHVHHHNWYVDCVPPQKPGTVEEDTCQVIMDGPKHVVVHFGRDKSTPDSEESCDLTVKKTGEGTVNPAVGTHEYPCADAQRVTVTATPDAHYVFKEWSDDCRDQTCTVTMDEDRTVTAIFEPGQCTFTVTAGLGGHASGGGTFECFTKQTATATPERGYTIDHWSGDCGGSGQTCTVTLNGNKSARVAFTESSCTGDKPDATRTDVRTKPGTDTTVDAYRSKSRPETQKQTRTVVCERGAWVTGEWTDTDDPPAYGAWTYGPWTITTPRPPSSRDLFVRTETGTDTTADATRSKRRSVFQPQTRPPVPFDHTTGRWDPDPWRNNGGLTYGAWIPGPWTITSPKPITSKTVSGTDTDTEVDGRAERTKSRSVTQTQTRTVSFNHTTGLWDRGSWTDSGNPRYGTWIIGGWTCRQPIAREPSPTISTKTTWGLGRWDVGTTVAYYRQDKTVTTTTSTSVWVGAKTCNWKAGTPLVTAVTTTITWRERQRPADDHVERTFTSSQTRWVTVSFGTFCRQYQERRAGTRVITYKRPHVWGGQSWVDGTTLNLHRLGSISWGGWERTGTSRLCSAGALAGDGASGDGAAGTEGETEPVLPQVAQLTAGPYRIQWGDDQLFEFTVPADAVVELRERTGDDGTSLAVFRSAAGAELVVDPTKLPASTAPAGIAATGVTDAVLTALAATLRQAPPPAPDPEPTEKVCQAVEADDDGAFALDLAAQPCAVGPAGATVTIRHGDAARAITLGADRDWLVLDATLPDGAAAVEFVDLASGGFLRLALHDGTELARTVPEGADGLAAIFDSFTSAAAAPAADTEAAPDADSEEPPAADTEQPVEPDTEQPPATESEQPAEPDTEQPPATESEAPPGS